MPLRLFQHFQQPADQTRETIITVVSGLPRSGTSMMMRMLEAGGLPILTDEQRAPDLSNPKGYYEFEPVKQMKEGNTAWIREARGKAVKIVSALLQYLPPEYHYRIIFMQRNMSEILASQREMLIFRGENHERYKDRTLADLYNQHLAKTTSWIETQSNLSVLYLNYNKIIADPQPFTQQLAMFLHPLPVDVRKMLSVVETSLYRQRSPSSESPSQAHT